MDISLLEVAQGMRDYLVLLVPAGWAQILCLWALNHFNFRKERPIRMHRLLWVILLTKFAYSLCLGLTANLSQAEVLSVAAVLLRLLFNVLVVVFSLLMAKSWCITRQCLSPFEKRIILGFTIAACCAELFRIFYQHFFLVCFVIMYIVVLRMVFVSVELSLRDLQAAITHTSFVTRLMFEAKEKKIHLLHSFKMIFLLFDVAKVLLQLLTYFRTDETAWIYLMVDELLDCVFFCAVLRSLRLRDFSRFYEESDDPPRPASSSALQTSALPPAPSRRHCILQLPSTRRQRLALGVSERFAGADL